MLEFCRGFIAFEGSLGEFLREDRGLARGVLDGVDGSGRPEGLIVLCPGDSGSGSSLDRRPAAGERVAVVLCGANTDPSDVV